MLRSFKNGTNAILKWCPLYIGTVQQRLADTGDGRCGVHHLVCQYTGEPLPRFHLVLVHLLADGFTQLIQRFLHGAFARQQAVCRHTEGEVTIADGLLHQMGTKTKFPLMANKCNQQNYAHDTYYNKEPHHSRFILL